MSLREDLERVSSKETLATFIQGLRENLASSPEAWENATLDSFMEALAAWTSDMDGYYRNIGECPPEQPSWKTTAEMLLAARSYE